MVETALLQITVRGR